VEPFLRFAREHLLPLLDAMPFHRGLCGDQAGRAQHVAELVVASGARVVRLMDGYGRVLLRLLLELAERGALGEGFRVELVDVDQRVSAFHRALYGGLGLVEVLSQDVTRRQPDQRTVVYMNFCGMAASLGGVNSFLAEYASRGQGRVVLSFSISRAARRAHSGWVSHFNHLLAPRFHARRVTTAADRQNFATYEIVRIEEKVEIEHPLEINQK
jgi:hypothetical protein